MKYNYFKTLLILSFLLSSATSFAVTQKEMNQARTIAAKAYLRYANDGSGYLDEINPTTMEELESALKAKEKENLKAFKAIPVPTDFASWDKERLVEYWAVSAFQNPDLLEKGRGGRIRARAQINKMTISAPAAETPAAETPAKTQPETPTPAQENKPETQPQPEAAPASAEANPAEELPDNIVADENNIVAEEQVLENDGIEQTADSHTGGYIVALAILVAIVIALVVFAAKVFKKPAATSHSHAEMDETLENYETSLADKKVEIAMLNKKLESLTKQNAELTSTIEALNIELAELRKTHSRSNVVSPVAEEVSSKPQQKPRAALRSIFLGRANAKGIFVRADRSLNIGHSIFVLDTTDGFSGSFRVADSPAAWSLALSNPKEYLETACTGYDLNDTASVSSIITETAGTAVFEGGCWRVIRKARIRYM